MNDDVDLVNQTKYLGTSTDASLKWDIKNKNSQTKISRGFVMLKDVKQYIQRTSSENMNGIVVELYLEYFCSASDSCGITRSNNVQISQNGTVRIRSAHNLATYSY